MDLELRHAFDVVCDHELVVVYDSLVQDADVLHEVVCGHDLYPVLALRLVKVDVD